MYYDEILKLTYEQITYLSDFINTLKLLQRSIVNSELDEIEIAIEQEEKILHRIKNCEERRSEAVTMALKNYKIEVEKSEALDKLADVLLSIDPELSEEFNQVRTILLEKVKEVLLLNSQNEIIISNSRQFIRDLIKNILGTKKENFFDRKI
ncbi:MAG: flagellar export chaperone FlgN [Ignavibacteriaceae bacterium]|nr:flagellar export chaperone FlgN [Ignavibacterium sp.]MCC6256016.1 flagellar export chaperone FlgN [Ignavibacteriaceae bacterium]HMN22883.1 flagellar export chaperone FlgN [Ignavibacteriaceae bacterium]HRN25659.1 flagellar export chaperone FlgN [Ignavibacteriaceae bacterium]HRP91711.1 flagellar export chaperone FlgN [Ignavibacteriaceae bacterium]